jgi:hypothetical protein
VFSFGSGRHPDQRRITDSLPSLNVFAMNRAGGLAAGTVTKWRLKGNRTATARAQSGRVLISVDDGPEQVVELDLVPGSTGGSWPQFICPLCGARRHHLYVGDTLGCRTCHRLAYRSRHTARPSLYRAARLRMRLVDPHRLSGKRRRRMLQLLEAAEAKAGADLAVRLKGAEHRARSIKR